MKKVILWIGAVVLLAAIGSATFIVLKMGPRNAWGMLRYDTRKEGDLAVGQQAPDVVLTALDGTRVRLHERMQGEKPVVLIFGSYT